MGDLFTNALAQAKNDFGTVDQLEKRDVECGGAAQEERMDLDVAAPSGNPLAGVVIFVSQKLAKKQGAFGAGDGGLAKETHGTALVSSYAMQLKAIYL